MLYKNILQYIIAQALNNQLMDQEKLFNNKYNKQIDNPLECQTIFSFSQCDFKSNKLVNKQLPSIQIDVNANTLTCKDSQAETSIARAANPLSTTNTVSYFQVEIYKANIQSGVNIGLVGKDVSTRSFAGKSLNSIGFIVNQIYCNKKKIASVQSARQKDRIGCGINCLTMTFFFTKNRKILYQNVAIPQNWTQFYPAVGAQNQNQCIKCYFQKHLFVFDIDRYIQRTQQQSRNIFMKVKEVIDEEEASVSDMYSLISEYMLFNGYTKTYALMSQKKQQIGFKPVKKLTRNPFVQLVVGVDDPPQKQLEEMISELNQDDQMDHLYQNELNQRSRQRFKSDVHPQMLMEAEEDNNMNFTIRKNTQNQIDIPRQVNFRKQSYVSNVSLQEDEQQLQMQMKNHLHDNQKKIKESQLKAIQKEKLTPNQKFLLTQRLNIIALIKQQKIEEAFDILKNRISLVFQKEEMLQIYMKSHIFLRKVKKQGAIFALNYARSEQHKFNKYRDRLFPAYNYRQKKVIDIPLKKIFGVVVSKNGEVNDLLREEQFQSFAQCVNSIIMKHMGIMQDCRLGLWIQHVTILQRKTRDFKGMTCGIQLNI